MVQSGAAQGMDGSRGSTTAMWVVRTPDTWPEPPTVMSYTALRDIETCPRRWSLRRADYPAIWAERGYPGAPALGTLEGQLVHASLEHIVLAASRPLSGGDPRDVSQDSGDVWSAPAPMSDIIMTLRRLGGISVVLEGLLRSIVATWASNPRLAPRARECEAELRRRLPALRQRVQSMLGRVDVAHTVPINASSREDQLHSDRGHARPLGPGVYPEVPLNNRELGWYGKADLLSVVAPSRATDDAEVNVQCSIFDFKTGSAKDDHPLQLRIYALLWARDKTLNPTARRVTQLKLIYPEATVEVAAPATDEELNALAMELATRTQAARTSIESRPPIARPTEPACEWCDVKHLCEAYWSPNAPLNPTGGRQQAKMVDLELSVLSQRSPASWLASVTAARVLGSELSVCTRVLVRARPHDTHFGTILQPGAKVRVLAAQHLPPTDESTHLPVVALTRSSEVFVVSTAGER